MSDDMIYRQDAIDEIEGITSSMSICVNSDECHGMKRMQRQAVLEITNMPSAQPEIIRCKDCKWKQGSECVRFAEVRPFLNDFCSRAERREE